MEEYERDTGAMHYHLNCANPENVFLVLFEPYRWTQLALHTY